MKNILIRFLKSIHSLIPPRMRVIYMSLVNSIRKIKYYIIPVYLYRGKEKQSGMELNMAYLGWGEKISSYWTERFFIGEYTRQRKKSVLVWNVYKYLHGNRENYDLAIVEMNNKTMDIAKAGTGFLLPRWFMMQIYTVDFMKRIKRHDILRRIRKNSLTFEERNSLEDFRFFYQRMYLPYIAGRHKKSAILLDYKYFLNKFTKKGGDLAFILSEGEVVAGSLCEMILTKIRMSGLGILDGREDILKMGVVGAVYYYRLKNYFEKGVESVNIGGTSPVLSDGLTKYKLSLGAKAEEIKYFDEEILWLIPLKDTLPARSILKSNPFIFRINNEFYRAVFIDTQEFEDKNEFLKYLNHSYVDNIKETNIFCFDNTSKIKKWIEEEKFKDCKVLHYSFLN
jgi:hypothetical protein